MIMEATVKCVVTGVRRMNFKDDGGKSVDMTQVFVEERFGQDNKDGLGSSTVAYSYGDSKRFEEFSAASFPCQVEAKLLTVTTGTKKGVELRDIKILKAPDRAGAVPNR